MAVAGCAPCTLVPSADVDPGVAVAVAGLDAVAGLAVDEEVAVVGTPCPSQSTAVRTLARRFKAIFVLRNWDNNSPSLDASSLPFCAPLLALPRFRLQKKKNEN